MTKKGRPQPSFFHYFLKIPPKSPLKIDFPSWRPKVVAVVLMVFSNALPAVDFFFLVVVLLELVLFALHYTMFHNVRIAALSFLYPYYFLN